MKAAKLGTRCEIKNLNSFRFMEQAIEFEARRQIEILEDGGRIEQETRLYDPERNETRSMRTKEDAQDYRYFPDPDLLPLVVSEEMLNQVRRSLPELPEAKRQRYVEKGVPAPVAAPARRLAVTAPTIFEKAVAGGAAYDAVANLVVGELAGLLNAAGATVRAQPGLAAGGRPRCRCACGRNDQRQDRQGLARGRCSSRKGPSTS